MGMRPHQASNVAVDNAAGDLILIGQRRAYLESQLVTSVRGETADHDDREVRVQRLCRAGIRGQRRRQGGAAPGSESVRAASDGICMTPQETSA
jgi:hypothetical protein